jgi:enoyl-[acyl-carrier protein] reductase II
MDRLDAGGITGEEAQLKVEEFWVGRLRDAVVDGDISCGSMMAGQSVGLVKEETSVRDIVDRLAADAEAELQRLRSGVRA